MKLCFPMLITILLLNCNSLVLADSYAVVIGVNECPHFQLPGGAPARALRGAEQDAQAIAELLNRRFGVASERITLLTGANATHDRLRSVFAELAKTLRPEDSFVFYFSGHGTQIEEIRPPLDEIDHRDEGLCLSDSRSDGVNVLADDELAKWLESLPAQQLTIILDCCHAGTGIKDTEDELLPRFLPTVSVKNDSIQPSASWSDLHAHSKSAVRHLCAFYACQPDQQAYERRFALDSGTVHAGQFTRYFLEGIELEPKSATDSKQLTQHKLFNYVQNRLQDGFNKSRPKRNQRQEPLLESTDDKRALFWVERDR